MIAFERKSETRGSVIVACNFTKVPRGEYRIGVPKKGTYEVVFSSDAKEFGGTGCVRKRVYKSEPKPMHGKADSIALQLPAMATVYLKMRN